MCSQEVRMDVFENDIFEVLSDFKNYDSRYDLYFKIHDQPDKYFKNKSKILKLLAKHLKIKIHIIQKDVLLRDIVREFDFGICGPTTGAIEFAQNNVPFVFFTDQ